jgi:hypothetical protein
MHLLQFLSDMNRYIKTLLAALALFVLSIGSYYFGPRYELHKFSAEAQGVLTQSGEDLFIGWKWVVLALGLFVLGFILTVIGGKGWIESRK